MRKFRIYFWGIILMLSAIAPAACTKSGELLYNGIVLPDVWPPRLEDVPKDPVEPFYLKSPPAVIPIDIGRQLFVDEFLVAETTLKRGLHLPEYYPGNTLFRQSGGFLWWHPEDGVAKAGNMASRDGIHWAPVADLKVSPGPSSWIDREATDPTKKYVRIYPICFKPAGRCQYWIRWSADGAKWSDELETDNDTGDASKMFFNPFRRVWVMSARHGWSGPRRRRYWEVRDLEKGPYKPTDGTPMPYWCGADSADPIRPEIGLPAALYNLDATAYESLMLGSFVIWRGQPQRRMKPNEVCVGFSRDGWSWSRPDRRPYFPVSESPTTWTWINVQSIHGMWLVMGDRLFAYVHGRGPGGGMALAAIRRDGFVSMDAGPEGGILTTRPVTFSGKHFFVNVDCPQGSLTVEALDEKGRAIEPFAARNCVPVVANKTLRQVAWKGAEDLSALSGKPVRFRFQLKDGSLYAFWVSAEESGASNGYVGAGGPGFAGARDTAGIAAYRAADPPPPEGTAPAPALWPADGTFTGAVAVRISIPLYLDEPGTVIRYTMDGTEPTEGSTRYDGPVTLTANAELKARAFRPGLKPGATASGRFIVKADTAPPMRFYGTPKSTLAAGTREVRMTVRTNEKAVCRFSAKPGAAFDQMTEALETKDGFLHETVLRGLADDQVYRFFVKAKDAFGNANADDYEVTFGVRHPATRVPAYVVHLETEGGEPVFAPPPSGPLPGFRVTVDPAGARLTAPMAIGEDVQAPVKYVSSPKVNEGTAEFAFDAGADGDYRIYAEVYGAGMESDSLFVSVDGGKEDVFDFKGHGRWHVLPVNGRGGGTNAYAMDPRLFPLKAGPHKVVFRGRKAGARLGRIAITVASERDFKMPEPGAAAAGHTVLLDAAAARLTAPMAPGESAAFRAPYVSSPEAGRGEFAFTFKTPALNDYVVWAKVFSPAASADTFFVSIDGRDEDVFDASWYRRTGRWIWQPVNGQDRHAPMARWPRLFVLEKGEHTLTFRCREPGARLGRVIVTDDRAFIPGDGD
jgi:hypothetical protein